MKKWYFSINDQFGQRDLDSIGDEIILNEIQRAIGHILGFSVMSLTTLFTINLYDYPPSIKGKFGQPIHQIEYKMLF